MPRPLHLIDVIHARTPHPCIGEGKSAGLDDVDGKVKTGSKPQNRAGILRDVRLKKSDSHDQPNYLREVRETLQLVAG